MKNFDEWADNVQVAYEARIKDGMGIAGVTKLALSGMMLLKLMIKIQSFGQIFYIMV